MSDDKPDAKKEGKPSEASAKEEAVKTTDAMPEASAPGDGKKPKVTGAQKKHKMHVKVYGPFKVYVDEEAYSISAVNHTGPFDVLGEHHKFITILDACEVVVHTVEETKRIRINRGVMHVSENSVVVFLDV
ncbi:MAG: hypothetical protein WBP26_00920 [Candidatus Saccharimonadales bacterium]